MSDTIAAISTGSCVSAIGVIRMSGDEAIAIADRVFRRKNGVRLADSQPGRLYLGGLHGSEGELIDVCMCTFSRAPRSYTGEDTAELQCHGSPVALAEALQALFKAGARQALPGEFTKRAFLNGQMDLSSAEAVIDLIEAQTPAAAYNAAGQLDGSMSLLADGLYNEIRDVLSHFYAALDWPDEDIEEFSLEGYRAVFRRVRDELERMLATYERGKLLRDGVKCAILGRPNVGKSSLLNALVGYERAIVTEVAGTTRDTVEERLRIGNVLIRLSDTAGLRDSEDKIEQMGVKRAENAARDSSLVIAVFDGGEELGEDDFRVLELARSCPMGIAVINKADMPRRIDADAVRSALPETVTVSALTGEGVDALSEAIERMLSSGDKLPTGQLVTNLRQAEAIARARNSVIAVIEGMDMGLTPDAVLTEAEAAASAIGEINGRTIREDAVNAIFSRFCVGK
ncbi:MAG: tRNA uridine-5-carboxymethylaminomethyl(34) synthesis GTPase MnmE [Oscillospiraceae bacterium]|nr:tRNA uridine-5-carboxymethylaminomethyl(34) synthesis GTPase MnmE [Oscillospiraceae bacterium]